MKNHPAPNVSGAEMEKPWSRMCVTRGMTNPVGCGCVCADRAVCDLIIRDSVTACPRFLAQGSPFAFERLQLCRCFTAQAVSSCTTFQGRG